MIVVDASVAVKWFVREPGHSDAIDVMRSESILVAPDLVLPEVINVLRRKQRLGAITMEQLAQAASALPQAFSRLIPASNLIEVAVTLSELLDHSVYDCCYLACAISSGSTLLTADQIFHAKAADKGYGEAIVPLADWRRAAGQRAEVDEATIASVLALHERFQRTLEAVSDLVSEPFGSSGTRIVNTGDLKPAFESPSYIKLTRFVASLSRSERAKLLALGWYGQSGEGGDWSLTLSRAQAYLSDDPADHLAYIISKIGLFGDGLQRLRTESRDMPVED